MLLLLLYNQHFLTFFFKHFLAMKRDNKYPASKICYIHAFSIHFSCLENWEVTILLACLITCKGPDSAEHCAQRPMLKFLVEKTENNMNKSTGEWPVRHQFALRSSHCKIQYVRVHILAPWVPSMCKASSSVHFNPLN